MANTPRLGEYVDTQPFCSSPRRYGMDGAYAFPSTGPSIVNLIFKNEGWYSAGSVWETWITSPFPSTVPPSGHILTFIEHILLQ